MSLEASVGECLSLSFVSPPNWRLMHVSGRRLLPQVTTVSLMSLVSCGLMMFLRSLQKLTGTVVCYNVDVVWHSMYALCMREFGVSIDIFNYVLLSAWCKIWCVGIVTL